MNLMKNSRDTSSSQRKEVSDVTSRDRLVEIELIRKIYYEQMLQSVRKWLLDCGDRIHFSEMQIAHILLRYIFNKKATTTPDKRSDPVFVTGTSKLARDQLCRDLKTTKLESSKKLADLIDDELARAARSLRFEKFIKDEAVTLSSPTNGKLIYRDDSQEDFAGLAQRYGSKYYNAAYALGLRYSYLRLTGHGLARAYKEDTKRSSDDPLACEGFASAFNHYFDRYYSAFDDLETYFGSRGCFFKIKWEQEPSDMTYYLCPPFDESLMQLCVDHVFNALEKRLVSRPTFVFSIPGSWTNFSALEQLKASTWVRTLIDYPKGKLPFIDYMATREKDRIIYPTDICVITLSDNIEKRKADCIDSEYSDNPKDTVAVQPIQKKRRNETDEGNEHNPEDAVAIQPIQKKRRNETDEGNEHNPEDTGAIQSIQKKRRNEIDEGNEHSPKDTVAVQPIQKKRRHETDEGKKHSPQNTVAVQPIQKKRRNDTDEGNEHNPEDTVAIQPIQKKRRLNEIDEENKQNPDDICGTEKIQLD